VPVQLVGAYGSTPALYIRCDQCGHDVNPKDGLFVRGEEVWCRVCLQKNASGVPFSSIRCTDCSAIIDTLEGGEYGGAVADPDSGYRCKRCDSIRGQV
jgi:DNA-directed RNA polymerase subunit RPC12/RpoP